MSKSSLNSGDNAIMKAIAEASLDALITINAEGNIIEFSPSAVETFGYTRDEALGRPVSEIVIPPRMRQAHDDGMANYHATGEGPVLNNRIEVPAIRRNGEEFPAELTVIPLEVNGDKYFTAFVRDITQQKAHEAELTLAREIAEQSSEAKSRFLAHMSHELRSPLTTVLGAIDLMLDDEMSETHKKYANMARQSGESLLDLISDILNFSKIESESIELQNNEFNLHALIQSLAESTQDTANSKNLDMLYFIDNETPVVIEADDKRLRQVLLNFIENAIKFTSTGGIGLTVITRELNETDVRLRFSVEDTGIGIPEDAQASIFEEFFQMDNSSSTSHGGAGLGLCIVSRIAKAMDARIGVESTEGVGSNFWLEVTFPYKQPNQPDEALPINLKAVLLSKNPVMRKIMGQQLECIGVSLESFPDFMDFELADPSDADLVLIDLYQNNRDCVEIQAKAAEQGIPAKKIVLLGRKSENTETTVSQLGFRNAFVKPVHPHALFSEFNKVMWSKTGADTTSDGTKPRPVRVLLAEDSESNQIVLAAILVKAGYEMTVANNGQEAVSAVELNDFDLVLMDMRMPIMDGLEATRQIRAMDGHKSSVPILALTANAMKEDIQKCMDAGMDDYATKPINKPVLLQKIHDCIHGNKR